MLTVPCPEIEEYIQMIIIKVVNCLTNLLSLATSLLRINHCVR